MFNVKIYLNYPDLLCLNKIEIKYNPVRIKRI